MDKNLKQELAKIEIPAELHDRSKQGIAKAKSEMGGRLRRFVKRRLAVTVLAACLVIPTGAFAYQTLLADDLYGSFDNLKKRAFSITMQGYLLFNAKLDQAQGELGKEKFAQFKESLSVVTGAKLDYGNKHGNIDYTQVPAEPLAELKTALYELQPFFDKLNGQPSSKEVLTATEYDQYIQALMDYETVMAQLGVTSISDAEAIPSELQEKLTKSQNYLDYVNEKQMGY